MRTLFTVLFLTLTNLNLSAKAGQVYYNKTHEFSIDFPEGWAIKQSSSVNTVIKAVYRDSTGRIAQITIAAYLLSKGISKTESSEISPDLMWAELKEQFPDFSIKRHDSGVHTIRSNRAVWNLVEITDPPQARMMAKHYHFIRGSFLYRVTAMSDAVPDFFNATLPVMDKSISTIAFGL